MSDQGKKEAIFPINSVHCDSSLQSILELSNHIGELTTVTLAQAMENQEDYGILVCKIFSIFKLTQKIMIQYKIPVRLEVPKSYFYTALFSYNAALINQVLDF